MACSGKNMQTPQQRAAGCRMVSSGAGRCARRKCCEGCGMERNGVTGASLAEGGGEIEVDVAAADGTADLRIGFAHVAMLVVRQRLVLSLLGQHVRDAMRERALLGEEQGEDKQRFQEQGT